MSDRFLIVSQRAIGDNPDVINIREMSLMRKVDKYNPKGFEPEIHFARSENSIGPKEIIWKYHDEACRDYDYNRIIEIFGTLI